MYGAEVLLLPLSLTNYIDRQTLTCPFESADLLKINDNQHTVCVPACILERLKCNISESDTYLCFKFLKEVSREGPRPTPYADHHIIDTIGVSDRFRYSKRTTYMLACMHVSMYEDRPPLIV